MSLFHPFPHPIDKASCPRQFTYPFHYTPHPLAIEATSLLQSYIQQQTNWLDELSQGKMFGVLVVENSHGEIGFLAAFSGILAGKNCHPFFVPPIYDLQQPDGFFRLEESQISALNIEIDSLQQSEAYQQALTRQKEETDRSNRLIDEARQQMKADKARREQMRLHPLSDEEQAQLIHESQHQKADFKRLKRTCALREAECQQQTERLQAEIDWLKRERKTRSAALQQKLFGQFKLHNALGEVRNLYDLFVETAGTVPPAGTGECAAPKLLQYAYLHQLHPICMAEFWWGSSLKGELRRHGYFYPSCQGKCGPILPFMLRGLDVEANPLNHADTDRLTLETIYEDEWLLVVHKPEGLLSVPGKSEADSVYQRIQRRLPQADGPLIVHRLDMATSGLLVIAKSKAVHQKLQAQFKNRTVEKRYIALLDGICAAPDEGVIDLPLSSDWNNRPRQMVDRAAGKPAITRYRILAREKGKTRIALYPLTGRTHQLRVHVAHPEGLNLPICGDALYGKPADRLYLHAEALAFEHPVTGQFIRLERKADF